MSTLENNKLIAEFMGYEFMINNIFIHRLPKDFLTNSENYNCFHNDWNWLMEAVKRITTLEEFQDYENNSIFWDEFCSLDIDSVHSQCVEFIKWYNEIKQD